MSYESTHRDRLLRHARTLAETLQDDELIQGILLGGSPAHGGADRESDVDLLVIVAALPEPSRRAAWLATLTGTAVDVATLAARPRWEWDEFLIPVPDVDPEKWEPVGLPGGLFCVTEAEVETDLGRAGEFLTAGLDEGVHSPVAACLEDLAHGIILFDRRGRCAQWQDALSHYPGPARTRLINYHWREAEIALNEDLQRAVWRSDWLHAYDRRVEGVRHLVRMLFAVNRRYFRKAKALGQVLPTFEACPPRAWERLIAALGEPDHLRAAAMLLALAGEIIDLVEPADAIERRGHWRELCRRWAEEHGIA